MGIKLNEEADKLAKKRSRLELRMWTVQWSLRRHSDLSKEKFKREIRLNLTFQQVRSKAKLLNCFKVNMTQPNIKHRLKTQEEEYRLKLRVMLSK